MADQKAEEGSPAAGLSWRKRARGLLTGLATVLVDGVFPPACPGCARRVTRHGGVCAQCWPGLAFIEAPVCAVYGTPFSAPLGEGAVSARAMTDPPPYARARAAVVYQGLARELVLRLKFNDRQDQADWMAGWMARAGAQLIGDADLIVPVPLHWRRFIARRFNQSAALARALSVRTGVTFAPEALARVRATATQRGLTAEQRGRNVAKAFRVPDAVRGIVSGKRILLVDDVFTTGATLAACAKALKAAGAAEVDCLTFAMVLRDGRENA